MGLGHWHPVLPALGGTALSHGGRWCLNQVHPGVMRHEELFWSFDPNCFSVLEFLFPLGSKESLGRDDDWKV